MQRVIYSIFRIMAADLDHAANTVDRCTDIMALTDICRPYSQKILRFLAVSFLRLSFLVSLYKIQRSFAQIG